MKDTGHRLSYSMSLTEFSVTDNKTGGLLRFNGSSFTMFSIEKDIVLAGLNNLLEVFATYKDTKTIYFSKPPYRQNFVVLEDEYMHWSMYLDGQTCVACEAKLKRAAKFDLTQARSIVAHCIAEIAKASGILQPHKDIVRRIGETGILVWDYDKHTIVCYERMILGAMMCNCLVDGTYYEALVVDASSVTQKVILYTPDFVEVIQFPLDASIMHFYSTAEDMFKEGGGEDGADQND